MGQYRITIEGTGAHHNEKEYDANVIAQLCVVHLLDGGHSVKSACLELGYYDENGIFIANSGEDLIHDLPKGEDGYARKEIKVTTTL